MTRAQFGDFCRASGLPERVGVTAVDLEALFAQQPPPAGTGASSGASPDSCAAAQ